MDDRLAWDPDDFNGTKSILVEYQEIWRPEVRFATAMKDESDLKERSSVRIFADGLIHVVDFRKGADHTFDLAKRTANLAFLTCERPQVIRAAKFRTSMYPFDNKFKFTFKIAFYNCKIHIFSLFAVIKHF